MKRPSVQRGKFLLFFLPKPFDDVNQSRTKTPNGEVEAHALNDAAHTDADGSEMTSSNRRRALAAIEDCADG
jgi:hypothetical protein